MSKGLCEKCTTAFFDVYETYSNDLYPFIHCHHDEEKEGCEECSGKFKLYFFREDGKETVKAIECKYCPNCGRKL